MGEILKAVIQRQVGPAHDDAWMTLTTLDFGKDHELSGALSSIKPGAPSDPRARPEKIDLVRLLHHIDATGG